MNPNDINSNSVWHNMVGTGASKLQSPEEESMPLEIVADESTLNKLKNMILDKLPLSRKAIISAALIGALAIGGNVALGMYQDAQREAAMQVVYQEQVVPYPDYTFCITSNGTGYYVDADGNKYARLNELDALQEARRYAEAGIVTLGGSSHTK